MKIASSINPDLYFTSLYDVVLSKVLATLSNGYRSVDDYMDREKSFTDKLYEMTSLKVTLIKKILNHNYPPLCSVSMWVHSGDLSTMKSHGSDLIKAKAELLERLSAAVPLDMIKSPDFLIKGVYEQVKDKKIKIKSIINNDTLSRGMGELYYYFGKYNNIDSVYNVDNKSDNCDIINYNKDQSIYIKNKKTQMTTNGCAGHFDYDKAVCAGWLAYIQRDGFLMYWLNSISPKVIDVDAYYLENTNSESSKDIRSNKDISKILLDLKKYNLEYYFLDITSDIAIPNVLCVIVVEVDGIKRLQMGAGTGFDADAALLSAALEAMAGADRKSVV